MTQHHDWIYNLTEAYDMPHWDHKSDVLYIGSGFFSTVWSIPDQPDRVLKVSHRREDACRDYLTWVFENPHPNAPKIYSIEHRGDQMFVEMDRYEHIPEHDSFNYDNTPARAVLHGCRLPNPYLPEEVFAAKIRDHFVGYEFDLHNENVMVDKHGNYIITDPVSCHTN